MGKVFIVGIGPGNEENRTIRADRALEACDVIAGYPVYVDLVKDRYPGKELVSTPMTQEARRCQMALDLAKSGKTVALVCSGDSGIYGMAALVYELRGENSEPEVEVVPGLTAACSGGAVLGAPLTHDFAVISLSDRLTPWETIENRLRCAAEGNFAIAIYNPASHGRPDHLKRGGRIGGTAAAIGTLIKLKIMLDFDREGKLRVIQKISGGKKRALKYILSNIKKYTFAEDAYPTVVHTGDLDGAKIFAEEIKKQYGIEPEIRIMGPTIGCHVGPGAVAFTFVSNELRP